MKDTERIMSMLVCADKILRNRIVHNYDGVNLKLVWEIISSDIPELRESLAKLI